MGVEQNHQSHFRNQKNQQDRCIRHHHAFALPDSSATSHECDEEHNAANDNDQDGREAVGSQVRKNGFIRFVAIEEQDPKRNKGDSSSHKHEVEEENQKLDQRRGTTHDEGISNSSLQEILRCTAVSISSWRVTSFCFQSKLSVVRLQCPSGVFLDKTSFYPCSFRKIIINFATFLLQIQFQDDCAI